MESCLCALTEKNKRMGVSMPHITALLSSSPSWTFLSYPASTQAPITSPCFLPSDFSTPIQLLPTTAFRIILPNINNTMQLSREKLLQTYPLAQPVQGNGSLSVSSLGFSSLHTAFRRLVLPCLGQRMERHHSIAMNLRIPLWSQRILNTAIKIFAILLLAMHLNSLIS